MKEFERIYQTDPHRENHDKRELHPSIELSGKEYLEKTRPTISKQLEEDGWVYKEPTEEESMSLALKEKFKQARKISKDTKVIDLRKTNEKSKSKIPAGKAKKNNSKTNKPAVAKV